MENIIVVNTTFSTRSDALNVAEQILEKRLAACIQMSEKILSLYRWKGAVAKDEEWLLTMKTKESLFQKLVKELKRLHPYDTPEIVGYTALHVENEYHEWVLQETEDN